MPTHTVRFPLGIILVHLNREGLGLGERGGFEAEWSEQTHDVLEREAFRKLVKTYLSEVYKQKEGSDAPKITLNLASHQLMDDIEGWTKLNYLPS